MKSKYNIEVEGGELLMRNSVGDHVIIPKEYRQEVQDMISDGCDGCIDNLVSTLPVMADYAEDGTLVPEWPPKDKEKSTWMPKEPVPGIPESAAINDEPPQKPVPKYVEMDFGKDLNKKQKFWNDLEYKYGHFVKGRQIYMDLYNESIPTVPMVQKKYDLNDSGKFPEGLQQLKNKINTYQDSINAIESSDNPDIDKIYQLKNDKSDLEWEFGKHPENQKLFQGADSWKAKFDERTDIEDPAFTFVSMMDEGGDQWIDRGQDRKLRYGAHGVFGMNSLGENVDKFIKKGYLKPEIKDQFKLVENELTGEKRYIPMINNIDDIISIQNAFIKSGKEVVQKKAANLGITLSPQATDYFITASFNMGEGGVSHMMDVYKREGLLAGEKFLSLYDVGVYPQAHKNALRRVQAKQMLIGEGVITPTQKQ